mmetsp:Transcript_13184/g.48069  ORF Transcript_13184/g.48069 Transcript_13184/m.48069 type:complete len:263 (+) Transcript_13184:1461-2249(+)
MRFLSQFRLYKAEQMFLIHTGRVMNMRVHLAHIVEVAMWCSLLCKKLFVCVQHHMQLELLLQKKKPVVAKCLYRPVTNLQYIMKGGKKFIRGVHPPQPRLRNLIVEYMEDPINKGKAVSRCGRTCRVLEGQVGIVNDRPFTIPEHVLLTPLDTLTQRAANLLRFLIHWRLCVYKMGIGITSSFELGEARLRKSHTRLGLQPSVCIAVRWYARDFDCIGGFVQKLFLFLFGWVRTAFPLLALEYLCLDFIAWHLLFIVLEGIK